MSKQLKKVNVGDGDMEISKQSLVNINKKMFDLFFSSLLKADPDPVIVCLCTAQPTRSGLVFVTCLGNFVSQV